jgi:hypothetical protein
MSQQYTIASGVGLTLPLTSALPPASTAGSIKYNTATGTLNIDTGTVWEQLITSSSSGMLTDMSNANATMTMNGVTAYTIAVPNASLSLQSPEVFLKVDNSAIYVPSKNSLPQSASQSIDAYLPQHVLIPSSMTNLIGLTGAQTATVIYSVPHDGLYTVYNYTLFTSVSQNTTYTTNVVYTDISNTVRTQQVSSAGIQINPILWTAQGTAVIYCKSGTTLSYNTGNAAPGSPASTYNLYIRVASLF